MRRVLVLALVGWTLACGGGAGPTEQITVATTAPLLPPELVEDEVVRPQEQALLQLSGLEHIESTATGGEATVELVFVPGHDLDAALLEVRDALAAVDLPWGVEPPRIVRGPEVSQAVEIWLVGEDLHLLQRDAERLANEATYWTGVTSVSSSLELSPVLEVQVDVDRAARLGLTAAGIDAQLGPIDAERPEEVLNTLLAVDDGHTVPLAEVAELTMGATLSRRHRRDGQQAVVLSVFGAEADTVARLASEEPLSVGVVMIIEASEP